MFAFEIVTFFLSIETENEIETCTTEWYKLLSTTEKEFVHNS